MNFLISNVTSPANLGAGAFTSALATRSNNPPEFGTHWDGFAKRNALRITGRATSTLMEVSIGSLWGEDPRYFRAPELGLKKRLNSVLVMTVLAHNREGHRMPAYARYISIPSSTYLSNVWRPESQRQFRDGVDRMIFSLISRVLGNTFAEFGPDLFKRFSKKKASTASDPKPGGLLNP